MRLAVETFGMLLFAYTVTEHAAGHGTHAHSLNHALQSVNLLLLFIFYSFSTFIYLDSNPVEYDHGMLSSVPKTSSVNHFSSDCKCLVFESK